ncbi:MAG: SDR family NAD(P)-dependent oxidoreductase [Elusimicrobiota bacterium]|nr:SDR family NAD(P)-dependent oxidoreductase [Elusimicrobiota bacterium]
MKKAIIIGATSGIGKELAKVLSENNYAVGIVGRRAELFTEFQKRNPSIIYLKRINVSQTTEAMNLLKELIKEMGGMDLIVISSGVGFINPELNWEAEKETIDVNISGFAAMANVAMRHFYKQGFGHLVGISSIAAIRGSGDSPAYNASKAFVSNYLEGLRQKVSKMGIPVTITDLRPGFVDTAMAKGEGLFWIASPQKAAKQIFKAMESKKKHAYITKRWRVIAWLLKIMPGWLYKRL